MVLLSWAQETACRSNQIAWNLSRRELLLKQGTISYSRLWSYYYVVEDPAFLNPQLRLYRPLDGVYFEEIHTTGFTVKDDGIGFAPQDAYFIHCDRLLLSTGGRLKKLRRYERQRLGSSWKFVYNYLPKLLLSNEHSTMAMGAAEFDALLASLQNPSRRLLTGRMKHRAIIDH